LLESALLGVVGALGAQLFTWMLHLCDRFFLYGLAGYIPPDIEKGHTLYQTTGAHGLWIIPAVTTLGGLLSGMLIYRFAPEAEGHGTDAAIKAFHHKRGYIRPVVSIIKLLASELTMGRGGSGSRE
jgi:CIC family chloride channel protein